MSEHIHACVSEAVFPSGTVSWQGGPFDNKKPLVKKEEKGGLLNQKMGREGPSVGQVRGTAQKF